MQSLHCSVCVQTVHFAAVISIESCGIVVGVDSLWFRLLGDEFGDPRQQGTAEAFCRQPGSDECVTQ